MSTSEDSTDSETSYDSADESGIAVQPKFQVHEIIDLDTMQNSVGIVKKPPKQDDEPDGPVVIRPHSGLERSQSSPFRKQARLSRMLTQDESSSDEDQLYTIGTIPESSKLTLRIQQASRALNGQENELRNEQQDNEHATTATDEEPEPEIVPMQLLSKIVNPEVLSTVKSHLKRVSTARKTQPIVYVPAEPSPAKLWEMKKKQKNDKTLLNKAQASKIKAGWKVRQCIANLPEEVDALFSMAKVTKSGPLVDFNINFVDDDYKSALIMAIDMKDESMMRKLMEHGVDVGLSIFHVIEADFTAGLKLILAYNSCNNIKIASENSYFKIGMTPMLMAAHKNNYKMLSMLYENGHRLTELKHWTEGIHVAWESSNERRMICLARAQPAYITLKTEVNHMNPMKYCLREIKRLRKGISEEHAFSSFYKDIICKYEDYMCSLLDFVSSSDELSDLFNFERPPPQSKKKEQIVTFIDGARSKRWRHLSSFELLERASRENLLALSYMRFRSLPMLRSNIYAYAIGLLFPFLSLFYIFIPHTALGEIITLPVVSFYCHMMSDIVFALLLLLKILVRDVQFDRLGEPVTALEWLIFLWILGKWVQEFQECLNRGVKAYARDIWNYTDIILLTLFTGSMSIRLYDAVSNAQLEHISRYEWGNFEPRLIGEGLQAFGYVFLFLRLLGLMRADRYLGPLQISLGKMLADIVRFLSLFALVLGAFAFGLSDLYWYYGTSEGSKLFCNSSSTAGQNTNGSCGKKDVAFSSISNSMIDLFWALFGLFELDKMSLQGKHVYTEYVGRSLVATYHVVAIIVMLNMLIAMMSKTYEDTSEDEEIAWKFHRTSVWIRFIRREVVRPPPMNLFPNPWRIKENFQRFREFCRRCCPGNTLTNGAYNDEGRRRPRDAVTQSCVRGKRTRNVHKENIMETDGPTGTTSSQLLCPSNSSTHKQQNSNQRFNPGVVSGVKAAIRVNFRQKQSKTVLTKLVFRYKIKYLTKK